jgi:hypothetical protein
MRTEGCRDIVWHVLIPCRCDGAKPRCYHCKRRCEETCEYDAVLRRRGPGKKNKAKQLEEAERAGANLSPDMGGMAGSQISGLNMGFGGLAGASGVGVAGAGAGMPARGLGGDVEMGGIYPEMGMGVDMGMGMGMGSSLGMMPQAGMAMGIGPGMAMGDGGALGAPPFGHEGSPDEESGGAHGQGFHRAPLVLGSRFVMSTERG